MLQQKLLAMLEELKILRNRSMLVYVHVHTVTDRCSLDHIVAPVVKR